MNPLYAIILGLVEGVSQWPLISSKTQTQVDIALHVVWPTGHLDRDINRGCSRDRRNILFAKVRKDKPDLRIDLVLGAIVLVVGIIVTLFAPQSSPALS